jgi:hypothetical protein
MLGKSKRTDLMVGHYTKGEEWPTLSKTKTEREGHPRGFCKLNAPPAMNRNPGHPAIVAPCPILSIRHFGIISKTRGRRKVFLHFGSLKNSMETPRLSQAPGGKKTEHGPSGWPKGKEERSAHEHRSTRVQGAPGGKLTVLLSVYIRRKNASASNTRVKTRQLVEPKR